MSVAFEDLDFFALMDASVEAVVIHDPDSKAIVWVNRAAADVYGYPLEELRKMRVSDLWSRDPRYTEETAITETDNALYRDHYTFEWRIRSAEGEEMPIETTATYVMCNGKRVVMIEFQDITNRKLTELELKRYEIRFREFMQDLAEGVCISSPAGRIEYLSPAGCRLLGCTQHSVIGRSLHEFLDQPSSDDVLRRFAAPSTDVHSIRYRIRRDDGAWRWHDATYRYVEMQDDLSGFLLHFRDITERIAAEKEAREKERMLEYLARHTAMGEMAAAIAHELSQPLAAVQNYIEGGLQRLQRDDFSPDELAWGLRHAGSQIGRVSDIIRSIRGYVVKHELSREVTDLNDIVNEVRYFVDVKARDLSVRTAWHRSSVALPVTCERVLIGQVILNLAFNAIEAMTGLVPSRRILRISTSIDGGYALMRVDDRGPGLPAEQKERIFEGFSTKVTGSGIGLSLCQSIVAKHGGTIWAETGKRTGATFCFKLPLAGEGEETEAA